MGLHIRNISHVHDQAKRSSGSYPCIAAENLIKTKGINCRVQFIFSNSESLQPLTRGSWEALPGWVENGPLRMSNYCVVDGLDLKLLEEDLDSYRDAKPATPCIVHPQGGMI